MKTLIESLCFTFRYNYECDAWMMRCTVLRKKPGTIPRECRVSTRPCLWQINLTIPALLGPPPSPIPCVSWGAAVPNWTQQPSCVVVVEMFQGHTKCLCWHHQPKAEWLLSTELTVYLVSVGRKNGCPVKASGNFTRVPQLLKYDGWWLSHFIHQLPQDPALSPLEMSGNVAALCIPGAWPRPVSDDCFVRPSMTRRALPALCYSSLSRGPLWPVCTNVLGLELCLETIQRSCWNRMVTYPAAFHNQWNTLCFPVLCLHTSRQTLFKIIGNWKCPLLLGFVWLGQTFPL